MVTIDVKQAGSIGWDRSLVRYSEDLPLGYVPLTYSPPESENCHPSRAGLASSVASVPQRDPDRKDLIERLGSEGRSPAEIETRLGISRQRVHQVVQAIRKEL